MSASSAPDIDSIFSIDSGKKFEELALRIFHFQAECNPVYRSFIAHLNINRKNISSIEQIPFLPIDFFKNKQVYSGSGNPQQVFQSSGNVKSRHPVADLSIYEKSFFGGFNLFYGNIQDYCLLALLPSYLERENSSLVYMADSMIKKTIYPESGFYLHELEKLAETLKKLDQEGTKVLLLGVSFALLDLAEEFPMQLNNTIVMETGGMKGRRREPVREELHQVLCKGFGLKKIHSEYGMTELLSQAYSAGDGKFFAPPWMRIFIRDTYDPLSLVKAGKSGGINIIDLANIYSCSFIATQDMGKMQADGSFEVLGRFDHSDIRGCGLLIDH